MGSASFALTIPIRKNNQFEHYLPTVYGCDDGKALTRKLSTFSLQLYNLRSCLLQERNSNNSSHSKLKTENDLQIQQKNFLLDKHTEHQEKASHKLHHTLQEAAESARELWNIIRSRSNNEVDDEANQTQPSNTWLKHASAANFESDGSTSHGFLQPEGRMVGRHRDCTVIKNKLFSSCFRIPDVISIFGMVGIGKTTVARNVYEDPSVASSFDVRGWVTVPPSQHYNKARMLSQLLQSITPVEEPNVIIRLWIAEGFVNPLNHNNLEGKAWVDLQDLIFRSLVLIEDQSYGLIIKSCRMHSALHSFCVGEAQKEGILCTINTQEHPRLPLKEFANSCRWLSFYSHCFDYYVLFGTNIPRSIFFFHKNPEMFVPLKLLKVLAFDTSISLQRVPSVQLGNLVFLRYLSITQWFQDLDNVVSNNPNLETLVVSGNGTPRVHLPSSIWKSPHLRHLELGNSYLVDPPSADKNNLQTLSWVVRPLHCRKKVYSKFPNIKNLKIFLKDDIEPNHIGGCCNNPIILDHFDCLEELVKLSISVSIGCNAALPEQCMYPSRLNRLTLSGTNISERDLNVIAMLPQLNVLKLENAFHGAVWNVVAEKGFTKLIFLLLEAKELKQWVVGQKHFQSLKHLVLRSCNCLEQIPECFGRISLLESIELEGCHSSLVASAKQLPQKIRFKDVKIKILGPKYDDSQNTHTELSM